MMTRPRPGGMLVAHWTRRSAETAPETRAGDIVTAQLPLRAGPPGGPAPRAGPGTAVIETSALTKRYPGAVTALDGLTVTVEPGITGLVGANGAGKSTLIKILLGLLPPSSGQAAVLGLDTTREARRIRTRCGYMPEHDCLPPDVTATEFVTHLGRMSGLPPTAAKERAAESLRHVGLYEERYRQIGTYSTGMKQRVKLAQALVGDPRTDAARRADDRARPGRPGRRCSTWSAGSAPSSASRSWCPRTCSARSSRSATT